MAAPPSLAEVYEAARAAWPELSVSQEQFSRFLEERPSRSHPEDLYLACACACGDPAAIATLEREHLSKIAGILRRHGRDPDTVEEVCQKLRQTLIGERYILRYSGEGKLKSWIEVIAKRMANREVRAARAAGPAGGPGLELVGGGGDLERDVIKRKLLAELQVAVREAGAALTDEQRELLRFHYRNGMSEAKLAKLFNTSQPTISRRLSKAKDLIFAQTRRTLQERLQLAERDFESLLAELRSRWLDLSLSRLFGGTE